MIKTVHRFHSSIDNDLNPSNMKSIAALLHKNTKITSLNLSSILCLFQIIFLTIQGNNISDGVQYLVEVLQENTTLLRFYLRGI
jgi:hypothetical protein